MRSTFAIVLKATVISFAAASLACLSGCAGSSSSGNSSTGGPNGALAAGGATSVYVVQTSPTGANSVLQFTAGANGAVSPTSTLTAPSGFVAQAVAVDTSGQIYMGGDLAGVAEVLVYAAGATGSATPARTILVTDPIESLSVDSSGSLYVVSSSSTISVFSSTATGQATPTRLLSGALTLLNSANLYGVAVDAAGNMYVSSGNTNFVGGSILVFAAGATGNVAPTRTITTSSLFFFGIAVDSSGNIFVAEDSYGGATIGLPTAAIVEFSPTASGAATPTKTIHLTNTSPSLYGGLRIDSVGNLYALLDTEVVSGATSTDSYSIVAFGPSASGTIAPAVQFTSTALSSTTSYPSSELAVK